MKSRKRRKVRTPRHHVVVGTSGPPCSRCGEPTEVREHSIITAKHLSQPFYYSRWYNCTNRRCQTTLIMPHAYIVWNDPEAETPRQRDARRELEDKMGQLTAPEGWL